MRMRSSVVGSSMCVCVCVCMCVCVRVSEGERVCVCVLRKHEKGASAHSQSKVPDLVTGLPVLILQEMRMRIRS